MDIQLGQGNMGTNVTTGFELVRLSDHDPVVKMPPHHQIVAIISVGKMLP